MKGFKSLTAKYIFISLILLVCMGIYVLAGSLFTQHLKGDERKLNLAARERLLTLNMAFHALLIIELPPSRDEQHLITMAEKSMDEYESVLYALKNGDERLGVRPVPESDMESVSNLDILIKAWNETQKPAMLELMRLPEDRKDESCGMCHSAIRENLGKIDNLVESLQKNYARQIRQFRNIMVYTLVFSLIMGLIIFFYLRKSIVIPIILLRDAASQVEKGNLDVRVDVKSRDEIWELSRSFNQMTEALDATFKEKKKLMEDLEVARVIAEAASHAKSDFLANVSHELRTPLNAVMGFSEIMRDGMAGPVTEEQKEYLNDIMESGQHLLDLINDILDLSKIEAGKVDLEVSDFDFRELLERSLIMFKEKAFKHRIDAGHQVAEDVGNIVADERRLKQVLFNLLSNAFKFTPEGGRITVRARILPGEPRQMECSVEDTGIGIKAEDISRLFRPFEQLESVLTKEHGGTGLGLALCRKIVELHDGRIWVESEFGKGSRFIFTIPIRGE